MMIPRCTEAAVQILNVIRRADVEWVPATAIRIHTQANKKTIDTMLHKLIKAGVLESLRGPTGGYKQAVETSLLELFYITAPSFVQRVPSANEEVNALQRRMLQLFSDVVMKP